jgi:arylamine N-acetyltransferase
MVAGGIGFGYWLPVEKVCNPTNVPFSKAVILERKGVDKCVDRGHGGGLPTAPIVLSRTECKRSVRRTDVLAFMSTSSFGISVQCSSGAGTKWVAVLESSVQYVWTSIAHPLLRHRKWYTRTARST